MGNIFIFSLIAGLAISILLIPFSYKPKSKEKTGRKLGSGIMAPTPLYLSCLFLPCTISPIWTGT